MGEAPLPSAPPDPGCRQAGSGALSPRLPSPPAAARWGGPGRRRPMQRSDRTGPTPPPGGMVHPARLAAPNAAAHPPVGRTIPPGGEGGGSRPAALRAHAPSSPPRGEPPSRRPSAAATAGPHGAPHPAPPRRRRPSPRRRALRSPFRQCGAGRRGAAHAPRPTGRAPRERTIDSGRKDKTCVGQGGRWSSRRGVATRHAA